MNAKFIMIKKKYPNLIIQNVRQSNISHNRVYSTKRTPKMKRISKVDKGKL